MTQTEVKINGTPIGATNEGGYTPFRFNLNQKILRDERKGTLKSESKIRFGGLITICSTRCTPARLAKSER
jgi:beta-galactosidase/beta-glucuronidase